MDINLIGIEKAIIDRAVEQIAEQFSDPNHEINTSIQEEARKLIIKRVNEAIEKEVSATIDRGLEAIVFPTTNCYGEKKKPDRTLREFIAELVKETFEEKLDSEGRPTKDSWYNKPENCRVHRVIKQAIENTIREDVTNASRQIHQSINHYLGEFVKQQLNEAANKLAK